MDYVNKKEIRVFGLKRSGNHAVIHWIFSQASGKVFFLNNCYPEGTKLRLYDAKGEMICKNIDYWDLKKRFLLQKNPFQNQDFVVYARDDTRFNKEKAKKIKKNCLIISFEDKSLLQTTKMLDKMHDELLGKTDDYFSICLLRDPFNLFASRIKNFGIKNIEKAVGLWKDYAKEFAGETKYLKHKVNINYNKWVTDKKYRKAIAGKLKFRFSDKGLNKVASEGGGQFF
jgi:hypothetical protein